MKAQQRVEDLSSRPGSLRRPNTVLGEPIYAQRANVLGFPRRNSNGNVDFNDFPSNRRDSKRFGPGLSTATVATEESKPTDCQIEASSYQDNRNRFGNQLNVDVPNKHIDVSPLDSVLQSPGTGSQPPTFKSLHSSHSFGFNDMDNKNWPNNLSMRFNQNGDDEGMNRTFPRSPSMLSKSSSHNNIDFG